ncbi:ead/Ea22-like family protein [Escherichia coli]|uniref:Ead/Ea22-like family protein n=2 Tax=Escherichia coli TaxID=562 RepID=A0A3P1YT97_ECOLX|nr:ead/Ea22-like family protein [Escherichia coli]ELO2294315.1 ead/Ea22-like family protein [Escherichia coli]MED8379756.1 ead/Ea22-like family protein [Escherichia coli]RRD73948.1 ead/Ea22-like family protein [Escherichia coli]HBC1026561.1 ead/Ea22-like family protein [Escherichia coli]HCG3116515.1 ead/Ea22-like family protein [Escherichia coli]
MSEINYKELREAAKQATQDEWVAYILPGHNGIYPARTSEGRHCGYFIDWPSVCQGGESINMSIRTYAVNCNDAWLNTEGDDISGSYVKYKDHQEVVAALEAKCAALAAENELARKAVQAFCDVVGDNTEVIAEEVGRDGVLVILGAMKATGNISATDAFLAEIRAEARNEGINYTASRLAAAFNHGFINKSLREVFDVTRMILSAKEELANEPHPIDGLSGEYAEKSLEEWAEQIRKGGKQ